MNYYQNLFVHHKEVIEAVISGLQAELQYYANRDDSNEKVIATKNTRLQQLIVFVNAVEQIIDSQAQYNNERYSIGRGVGIKEADKEVKPDWLQKQVMEEIKKSPHWEQKQYMDENLKETIRHQNIFNAQSKWSDHF